jgi:hypothetical protein
MQRLIAVSWICFTFSQSGPTCIPLFVQVSCEFQSVFNNKRDHLSSVVYLIGVVFISKLLLKPNLSCIVPVLRSTLNFTRDVESSRHFYATSSRKTQLISRREFFLT